MMVGNDETVLRIYGIGLAYHPVSFFAIEPGVFFKKGSYERVDVADDPDSISTEDYLMIGSSIGLYYYSDFGNGLYLYLGPRFDLSRTEEDDKSSSPGWSNKSETREMDYSISFIVGFKYMFNDHVGIFADMGFGYYKRDREYKYWNNTGTLTDNETTTDESFALSRAILGVAFYL
ncbi:MAG: hypothetical protein KBA61_03110 [Spirochaetes bacterium]|nr:hypothetical protein [Spirochaetota bacterium]